jgi:membrane fusion protein, multidrug efflux system
MPEDVNVAEVKPQPVPTWKERIRKFYGGVPLDVVPLVVLGLTVFLVILYANDWKLWDGMRPFETTNDAYVRADVTPLSTKVSGTVSRVLINDFDQVKKGQVLVELRNDDFVARAKEAESTYHQSLENIATTSKEIEVQKEHIESARLSELISNQDITRAGASIGSTEAALAAAKSGLEEAKAQKAQAQARLNADQALELRDWQERQRQTELYADAASTKQTIEQVVAVHDHQKATVAADRAEIDSLANLVGERTADIARINQDLKSVFAQDLQAKDHFNSRTAQLIAERKELEVLEDRLKEARSTSKARFAAWQEALVELDYTKIVAPVDGTLSERRVRAGQQVSAGTQVVTIVSSVPWVIASYRETQIRNINVGSKAEISVDALGGSVLKATVQSLSPASEAQFALLPPDNPSGNFTKITQRLPIKLVFDPNQKLLPRLKSGMTVIVTVWPRR